MIPPLPDRVADAVAEAEKSYKVKDIADLCGVSVQTVYDWRKKKTINLKGETLRPHPTPQASPVRRMAVLCHKFKEHLTAIHKACFNLPHRSKTPERGIEVSKTASEEA